MYISLAHILAKKQTQTIREIVKMPSFSKLFDVHICDDTSAKDNFQTTAGGNVIAAGSGGTIVGRGAGIHGCQRFGGCIIIDDIHKPDEVTSDTIRQSDNEWYYNTLQSRVNSMQTPIIFIGQRLHEDDLAANLIKTGDWETIILKGLSDCGNPLYPEKQSKDELLRMKELSPYIFSAQIQQQPQPAGGSIFKPEDFCLLEEDPDVVYSFITADTAETDKTYNDATAFSFWGLYKIKDTGVESDIWALHWITCRELRVEPKDLENEFYSFISECMQYKVKPQMAAIEKKSTGVTLLSILSNYRGLQIREISRNSTSGSKSARFLQCQPFVAKRLISLPSNGVHTTMCIEHCRKITANNTHSFDDIADTMSDAIRMALMDSSLLTSLETKPMVEPAKLILDRFKESKRIRQKRTW